MRYSLLLLLPLLCCFNCSDPVYTPKPRSYPRVIYPAKTYEAFDESYCHFTFQYPQYAVIEQDTSFFEEAPPSDCWFDVYFPTFDSRMHFTYVDLRNSDDQLERLRQEAFKMADWHNKRANYIDELLINTENGVSGMAFDIDGDVASPFQFFVTDSTNHYLRGALYFNTQARSDSLKPVIDFIREDILHLIETFEWEER